MEMNRKHPKFSEALELLCTLPRDDHPAPLSLLAADFGFATQQGVRVLLERLAKKGHTAIISQIPGEGYAAGIPMNAWPNARQAATQYWERVYGGL